VAEDEHRSIFVKMLREGYAWQEYAKRVLEELGFEVRIDPLRIAPSWDVVAQYCDWDDLRIRAHSGRWVSVSVKSRKTRFHGPDDYPYPRCIVDSHKAIDQQRVAAILVVSQYTRGWIVIPMTSRDSWRSASFPTPDGPKVCYWVDPSRCKTLREFAAWLRAT
jgi:hypothetical protein